VNEIQDDGLLGECKQGWVGGGGGMIALMCVKVLVFVLHSGFAGAYCFIKNNYCWVQSLTLVILATQDMEI
jgi:hypothetical protein